MSPGRIMYSGRYTLIRIKCKVIAILPGFDVTETMKRGDAKRAALIEAAAALLIEKGLAGMTTREIAERAKSTERTLFKQFGNKEGLLTEVLDRVAIEQLDQSLFVQLETDPPRTWDAFERWNRAVIVERAKAQGTGSDAGRMFLVEILQNPTFKARYSPVWLSRLWRPLVACLDTLKAGGAIAPDADTAFLARSFLSLHLGYLVTRLNIAPGSHWDSERDAAQLAALFRAAAERR